MGKYVTGSAMLLCAWLSAVAGGQTLSFWNNPAGGNYSDGSNWSLGAPGLYPAFNLGSAAYTVTTQPGNGAFEVIVENDNPTLNLNGNSFSNDFVSVATQPGWNGSLTIQGPGTFDENVVDNSEVDVGGAGATAQLTVNRATLDQEGEGMVL